MASLMLLLDGDDDVTVGRAAASGLARLGITSMSLYRDATALGVVVEGWAFPSAAGTEAARVLIPAGRRFRILPPVLELSLSSAPVETTERSLEAR
jgi:hypothetical protein